MQSIECDRKRERVIDRERKSDREREREREREAMDESPGYFLPAS